MHRVSEYLRWGVRRAAMRGVRPTRALLTALALPAAALSAQQSNPQPIEIRIAPLDYLIPHEARTVGLGYDGTSPYYEFILQAILFVNRTSQPLTVDGATIELRRRGDVLQQTAIAAAEMERAQRKASAIERSGMRIGLDVLFAAATLVPKGVSFSPTLTLAPGTAGLVDDSYLVVRTLPDSVTIVVRGRDGAGAAVSSRASFPVRPYESKVAYSFPLEPGEWFVFSFPGIRSHHWWTAATEHGIDITMVDNRGSWARGDLAAWREGGVPRWEDWYAYDKKVLAAADGIVAKVVDSVAFPLSFWNRRSGESLDAYRQRIGERQSQLFMAPGSDPISVAAGNHILIRHANGEHTFYAHLAHGKIRVREGQAVKRGEHIAGVGGTGEAPSVHLHFQVMDGMSMMTSRTFPVQFTDVRVNEQGAESFAPRMAFQSGYFVTVSPRVP